MAQLLIISDGLFGIICLGLMDKPLQWKKAQGAGDVLMKLREECKEWPQILHTQMNSSEHKGDWRVAFGFDNRLCQLSGSADTMRFPWVNQKNVNVFLS